MKAAENHESKAPTQGKVNLISKDNPRKLVKSYGIEFMPQSSEQLRVNSNKGPVDVKRFEENRCFIEVLLKLKVFSL